MAASADGIPRVSAESPAERHDVGRNAALVGLSLLNYGLGFTLNVVLARNLTVTGFDDYNVAVSAVVIMSTLATLGLEKYALRCLPAWRERGDWSRSRGFLRFGAVAVAGVSVALFALLASGMESILLLRGFDEHIAIVIMAAFLPVVTLFLFALEVATAYGAQVPAVAIYRGLLPVLLLGGNLLVLASPLPLNVTSAAAVFGVSWTCALAAAGWQARRVIPPAVWSASSKIAGREWLGESLPMLTFSLLLTVHAQAGVIILELMHPSEPMVSEFAVALQAGTFVVLIATATNRFYLPILSVDLERRDTAALRARARRRMLLIGPPTVLFVAGVLLFGRRLLSLFRREYTEAYPALCVIAIGAAISTIFSLAPYFLQFVRSNRLTLNWTAGCVICGVAACVPLSAFYGALGAAIAYAVPLVVLHLGLWWQAQRVLTSQFGAAADDDTD